MSKVHVYTITYNEEVMLPQFIEFYRERFPGCKITVFDNESTDSTTDIAIKNGCEVISWHSGNTIRDDLYLQLKNTCWKNAEEEWVIIVDCDEFIDMTEDYLSLVDFNIVKTQGWEMIGDSLNTTEICYGTRSPGYDKVCMFKPSVIEEINYEPGAHEAKPVPTGQETLVFNSTQIKLWHYKWLTLDYVLERYELFEKRLSDINKQNGWGIHYTYDVNKLTEFYETQKSNRIKVR